MNEKKEEVSPMSKEEAQTAVADLEGWQLSERGDAIVRPFEFKNFAESLEFVNKVGQLAEVANHHPDFSFGWGYCHVVLMTHSIGGLHPKDFEMAAKINGIA